jgi:hypothetical protein
MAKKGFMSKCGKWTPVMVFFGAFAAVFAAIKGMDDKKFGELREILVDHERMSSA